MPRNMTRTLISSRVGRHWGFPSVPALPGGSPPAGPADPTLPQLTVDVALPVVTGTTFTATTSSELATALTNAQYGDEIVLTAGAVYAGSFMLPVKPGYTPGKWILIRSSAVSSLPALPAAGVSSDLTVSQPRVYPQRDAAFLATIRTPDTGSAVDTAVGANGYYFRGITFELSDAFTAGANYAVVSAGAYSGVTSFAQQSTGFVFNQCTWRNAPATTRVYKHLRIVADNVGVVNCHFYGGGLDNGDANAIWIHRSRGPLRLQNCFVCHNGENVLSGGADLPAWFAPSLPSDVQVFQNRFWKDRRWFQQHPAYTGPFFGSVGGIKNIFEVKDGVRWHFLGNVFDGSTAQGQSGQGLTIKSVNQGSLTNWAEGSHVTIDRCLHRNVGDGFYISALETENGGTGIPVHHVKVTNCVWLMPGTPYLGDGRGLYFAHRDNDAYYQVDHCTIVHAPTTSHYMFVGGGGQARYSRVTNTIFGTRSVYGFWGYDAGVTGQGKVMFDAELGPTCTVDRNVLVRAANTAGAGMAAFYNWASQTHYFPVDNVAAGLNADGTLAAGSPCLAGGAYTTTDGKDQGADWAALNAAIAGVEIAGELAGYGI